MTTLLDAPDTVTRAVAGDRDAFADLYRQYHDTVFRFIYHRVGNPDLAKDLTSETFLRALKRIGTFTWQDRDLSAWLVTIARNLVADHFKSARYRREMTVGEFHSGVLDRADASTEGRPEAAVVDHATHLEVLRCLNQLTGPQRDVLILRHLRGLSVAETAAELELSVGAVKAVTYRAMRAIAAALPQGWKP